MEHQVTVRSRARVDHYAVASQAVCGVVAEAQQELSSVELVSFRSFICECPSPRGDSWQKDERDRLGKKG